MFGIGTQELLIIFLIVLLLFGANRIPEIGRAMGRGIRDFKRATKDLEDDISVGEEKRDPGRLSEGSGTEASSSSNKQKTT
jgi:TatA/E family protein of Tat protein translocase